MLFFTSTFPLALYFPLIDFRLQSLVYSYFTIYIIKPSVNETQWSRYFASQDPRSYSFYFDLIT